jgi:hypothetical protein
MIESLVGLRTLPSAMRPAAAATSRARLQSAPAVFAALASFTSSAAIMRPALIAFLLPRSLALRTPARAAPALRSSSASLTLVATILTRFAARL